MLSHDMIINIENDFNRYMALFPKKADEIKEISNSLSGDMSAFFMKAVVQMSATDIISVNFNDILKHVSHIFKIVSNIDYSKKMPIDIILDYVLPYRVNDEDFLLYSTYFFEELENLIDRNDIEKSALEINYWCYSKATYAQADDRTQNAITTVKSGIGRCGEESVLLVSALRSAGIPSRQCYSPYWSHCDDNHAWVEIFTGDKWKFLGACEPEEVLNIGWFNNAASRALAIRHRCFGFDDKRKVNGDQNKIFSSYISTSVYGKTRNIAVSVMYDNEPVSHAKVGIYIINYCMPKLILEKTSDEEGKTVFEVGLGDFLIFAYKEQPDDKEIFAVSTFSKYDENIIINLSKGNINLEFNLIPHVGNIQNNDFEPSAEHEQKKKMLLDKRIKSHQDIRKSENKFIRYAELNKDIIEKFLEHPLISDYEKNEILSVLTKKDYTDVTFEALCDMHEAYSYADKYPEDIFKRYLLPLRVENEPLYSYKKYASKFFSEKNISLPNAVIDYVNSNIKLLDDYTYVNLTADLKGVLQNNIATSFSLPIHVVQILRSIGIPARLSYIDRSIEYYENGTFVPVFKKNLELVKINFNKMTEKNLKYGENFTICKIENGYFKNLGIEQSATGKFEIQASKGLYAITQASRQIDGSVVGNLQFIDIDNSEDKEINLYEPIDSTKEKIKLKSIDKSIINEDGKVILAYIENGTEPTEHFLNELLENENKLKNLGIKVILNGVSEEKNNILSEVLNKGIAEYRCEKFSKKWKNLRADMGIGDLRLPFITAVSDQNGLFSFANYNVGTVELLIKILE